MRYCRCSDTAQQLIRVVLLLSVYLLLFQAPSPAAEQVTLQLAWKHQFQFAGYYAALHKGFYREAGLDVELVEGGAGKFAREELKEGHAHYGVAGSELLLHRMDGDPFVVLAPIFQHSASILLTMRKSGMNTLQDLVGKRIMLLPGDKDADILAAFLKEGISLEDFTRLDQSYNLDDLVAGRTDAVSAYLTNEPYLLQQRGISPTVISPQTYGVDFYSDCLFTTEHEVAEHPQRAKKVLQASIEGWRYALAHPEEIIELIVNTYNVDKTRAHLRFEAKAIRELIRPDFVEIGHMNPGRWSHIGRTYVQLGALDSGYNLEGFLYEADDGVEPAVVRKIILAVLTATVFSILGMMILLRYNRNLASEVKERKEAEAALKKSKELHAQAQRFAHIGHWEVNPATGVPECSEEIFRIFGLEPPEDSIFFSDYQNYIHADDKPYLREKVEQAVKENNSFNVIVRATRKSGEGAWLNIIGTVSVAAGGELQGIFGTVQDITPIKRIEVELQEREELLREVGRIAKIGGWEHNYVSGRTKWTPEIYGIMKISSDRALDHEQHLGYFISEDRQVLDTAYRRAMATGEPFDLELRCLNGEERLIWVRMIGSPEFQEGKCVRIKGTLQEITERKAIEGRLQRAEKMESIGNLAGGIAHDFNNILSPIMGFTELSLNSVKPGSDLEGNLSEVLAAGKRARDLIQQILTFARQSEEKKSIIKIATVVKEVLGLLRSSLPTTIEIKTSLNSSSVVWANATQLHQVIVNLCTNAAQAMEEHGGILGIHLNDVLLEESLRGPVNTLKPGKYAELKVFDTGKGIEPGILDTIFEPYFTTKEVGEGTGMGLAVAQGIVENYGGLISVESQVGKGAIFTVLLPVSQKLAGEKITREENLPRGNERILCVDDEEPVTKLEERMLASCGYSVTTFTSSAEALAAFISRPADFDLVISDMTMPRMTGDVLAKELRKVRNDIPVILATGYNRMVSDEMVRTSGVRALIFKPLVMADLARIVRQVLDGEALN